MTESEEKSELGVWFLGWWEKLPKHHFTSQNKGSRQECWNEIKKLKPNSELRDKIDWYTRERTYRYAKMKATHKLPGWKHACRLIKYTFWEDDLEGVADQETLRPVNNCACGKPVDFGPTNQCWGCRDADKPIDLTANREALRKINLTMQADETRSDYNARCRAYACQKDHLASLLTT